jgi:RNA polymerase sigma-70 factor (ECF subfamily)
VQPISLNAFADRAAVDRAEGADEDLDAAQAGDAAGFVRIVRAQQARVFSIALRLTGRRDVAEELAQDTFLQLHGALARIESAEHLRRWLYRAVTHRSIDRLRSLARQPVLVAEDVAVEPAAYELQPDPLLHGQLRELLLQLPAMARAVLVLRYQEDLDPADIARALDLSINTVKSHLRRSLDWLRTQNPERTYET